MHNHISKNSVLALKSNYTECGVKWCVVRVNEFHALKVTLRDSEFELSQWVSSTTQASTPEQETFHIRHITKTPRLLAAVVLLLR